MSCKKTMPARYPTSLAITVACTRTALPNLIPFQEYTHIAEITLTPFRCCVPQPLSSTTVPNIPVPCRPPVSRLMAYVDRSENSFTQGVKAARGWGRAAETGQLCPCRYHLARLTSKRRHIAGPSTHAAAPPTASPPAIPATAGAATVPAPPMHKAAAAVIAGSLAATAPVAAPRATQVAEARARTPVMFFRSMLAMPPAAVLRMTQRAGAQARKIGDIAIKGGDSWNHTSK